jgi:hypothetical protein
LLAGSSTAAVVMTATIGRQVFAQDLAGRAWHRSACVPNAHCSGFVALDSTHVRATFDGASAIDFDASGTSGGSFVDPNTCNQSGTPLGARALDRPIRRDFSSLPGAELAEGFDGSVFVRRGASFERIVGGARTATGGAIVARQGLYWVFRSGGTLLRVDPTTHAVSEAMLNGFVAQDIVLGAAVDTANDAFLLVGHCVGAGTPGCKGDWIRRVARSDLAVSELAGAAPEGAFAIAELVPGQHVVATRRSALYRIQNDAARPIDFALDDPFTKLIETATNSVLVCQQNAPGVPQNSGDSDRFRALSAAGGVAWAAGCAGTIVRIDALGAFAVAPTRSLAELAGYEKLPHARLGFSTAQAVCADSALFGLVGRNKFDPTEYDATETIQVLPSYAPEGQVQAYPVDKRCLDCPPEEWGSPFTPAGAYEPYNGPGWVAGYAVSGAGTRVLLWTPRERAALVAMPRYDSAWTVREDPAAVSSDGTTNLILTQSGRLFLAH